MRPPGTSVELAETRLVVGGAELAIVHPAESEALLDDEAFEREEFLPYWAELWPSGVELARAVAARNLHGLRVLELGAGLAVPSLAAALRGAHVLATDWSPDAIAFARANADRNGVALELALVDWARPAALVESAPWDLVLAADVLYERRNAEVLAGLLPRLVADGEVLIAEPGRPAARGFLADAARTWRVDTTLASATPRVEIHALRRLG